MECIELFIIKRRGNILRSHIPEFLNNYVIMRIKFLKRSQICCCEEVMRRNLVIDRAKKKIANSLRIK